ncbi:ABC transporter ATP-binding protein [Streptomyces sp. NPDC021218]|uniref:ABC transporter ATP-binding protein n=1 Tax=unclassified Streptomyces TaxID=2593676 RepID=UPI00367A665B
MTTAAPRPDTALPVAAPHQLRSAAIALVRVDAGAFALLIGLNAMAAAAGLASPWLLGRMVDEVGARGDANAVDRLALGLLLFALAQFLLTRYARYVGYRFGERTMARIREQFTDRVLRLPVREAERAGSGDLSARGTGDIAAVAGTLRDAGPDVLISLVRVVFTLVMLFVLAPALGLCGLVGLLGIWCVARWYLRRAHTAYLAEGAANSQMSEVLSATASGARTVEALGLQARRAAACRGAIELSRQTRERTLSLRTVLFPSMDMCFVAPVVAVLAAGGALHFQGALSLGTVVACVQYAYQLSAPLEVIVLRLEQLQSSGASFARVEGLGRLLETTPAPTVGAAPAPRGSRIEVTGVHYAYDNGVDILRGVDLTVRPGERLALVGPSGSGKTTLGRLLAGMDRPRAGTVTVGNVPTADLDSDRLRRQVILVTQEHHVFTGTIRDNLLLAVDTACDTELRAALATVGADWFTALPDGLDTEVGITGLALDAAAAQQLTLARVVLADPHTLILDEATALLDPTAARHAERALAAVLRGRTVIAIAHRLHTARDADRVAVMEGGRVTESGTHDALVAAGGAYAALWNSWNGQPTGR